LLKALRNSGVILISLLLSFLVLNSFDLIRKSTVTFKSADGLEVTADQYISDPQNPYLILFHEQESSRGEFGAIARRLCKMDYNCLAVDLRNGGSKNFISNETTKLCRDRRCSQSPADIEQDMIAAINFAREQSSRPVILLGSCANGSLALKLAGENENVRAVVAFSPGEYFLPQLSIQDTISGLEKPAFITAARSEIPYVSQLISGIEGSRLTLFEPQLGEGNRGTESLLPGTENNSEYWLALLLFFKDLI
jgi:pimeloyl-ACP methyl ester carboxylesterase